MPIQTVDIPGVGPVDFPDSMTNAQVNAAATRLYQNANIGKKQPPVTSWTDQGRPTKFNISDSPDPEKPSTIDKLNSMLEPLAHPKTAGDFAGLLIPSEAGATVMSKTVEPVVAGVKKYGGALLELAGSLLPTKARKAIEVLSELNPAEWNSPFTATGRDARAHEAVAGMVDRYMPNSGGASAVASPTPASAAVPYAGPSPAVAPKMAISAIDVSRIKSLVSQGLSQGEAVQTVMNLKVKGLLK